jgi:hypothetical protein
MVMIEQRQTLRSRVIYGAVIAFNERRSTIECIVRNFSDDGAKIEFENPALLPDEVDLFIAKKSRAFHAKMVWRQANAAGLAFDAVARNAPISLDWARRLRHYESERRELQSRIAQLLSER